MLKESEENARASRQDKQDDRNSAKSNQDAKLKLN